MTRTLRKLGVFPLMNASGDAQDAALAGTAFIAEHEGETGEQTPS
jgi:hypothetical protein